MTILKRAATVAGMFTVVSTFAAPAVKIDKVVQRWPWNNKVDISYTVTDGQDVTAQKYYRLVFKAVINGITNTIDGVSDIGASASTGSHTVTWTAPTVAESVNCEMSVAIHPAEVPSGDDYLVVNLLDGTSAFEGQYADLAVSLERYQGDVYKTDKMVLRKVPAGGTYPSKTKSNVIIDWKTDRDFYMGIYMVTQRQYMNLGYDSNPSGYDEDAEDNPAALRPMNNVAFTDVRGPHDETTSPVPGISSLDEGTFFQRLNFVTGNRFAFDLPTEVMFEMAERAGTRTVYYWGDEMDTNYVVCAENSGGLPQPVGSRLPNAWGLYDMAGNLYEYILDDASASVAMPTPWVPAYTPGYAPENGRALRLRGGGTFAITETHSHFKSVSLYNVSRSTKAEVGFRAAWIVH